MESAKELSKLKVEAGVSAKDLGATFDGKLAALRAEAEARRLAEVQALEDATKAHVQVNATFFSVKVLNLCTRYK